MQEAQLVEWFQKWRRPIRSWLKKRASIPSGEIDDLAQEVFFRLLRYSNEAVVSNPQGYLFRIAANVANEWRERSCNRRAHSAEWLEELEQLSTTANYFRDLDEEEMSEYVNVLINSLPERRRCILVLHVYENLTYKQIATKLGLTYRIVLRELTRAYSAMRYRITKDGVIE